MSEEFDYTPRKKRQEGDTPPPPPRKRMPVDEEPAEAAPARTGRTGGEEDYTPRAPRKERAAQRETGGTDYTPRPPRSSPPGRPGQRPARRPKRGKSDGKFLWRLVAIAFVFLMVVPLVLVALDNGGSQSDATVAALQATLAKDPNDFTTLVDLGNYYFNQAESLLNQNDADGAAAACALAAPYYERALRVKPEDTNVRTDLGTMYYYQGRLKGDNTLIQQAVDTWQVALSYEPDKVQTLLNLGLGYAALGQTDQAIAEWQRVIEVAPGTQEATTAQNFIDEYSTQPAAPTPTPAP